MSAEYVIADFVGKCLEKQWNDGRPINPGAAADLVAEGIAILDAAGYAVVPKKPTEAMRIAALCTHPPEFVGDYPLYEKCWRAMLKAAKETP